METTLFIFCDLCVLLRLKFPSPLPQYNKTYSPKAKDGTGAYFQVKESHKGQIVYLELGQDKNGKVTETPRVEAVYVFDSAKQTEAKLKETQIGMQKSS